MQIEMGERSRQFDVQMTDPHVKCPCRDSEEIKATENSEINRKQPARGWKRRPEDGHGQGSSYRKAFSVNS